MRAIDESLEPEALADRIVQVSCDDRLHWVKEWVPNFRRLAGFTEKDVPVNRNQPNNQRTETEPAKTRYTTTFNVTRNFFYRLLGRIMPLFSRFQVLSATRDQEDRDAADVASKYLQHRTSADSGDDFEPLIRAISLLFAGGPVYYRVEPRYGEEPDVDSGSIMPTDMYYYPGICDLNESPYIVVDERLTRTVIKERYPDLYEKVDWEEAPGAKWPKDVDLEGVEPELGKGCYTVRRLMGRPSEKEPEGVEHIMIVGSDGYVETREKLDTADGKYPFVTISDIPMGPFYRDRGRMTISARMQRTLDICISKALDVVVGGPQIIVGLPQNVDEDDFTNRAYLFYDKVPGQELTIDQAPGIGNLQDLINISMQFMAEVHAQHGPSRGEMPSGRTSGRALEHMTAMDVAVDEPFMAMIRRAVARIGKRMLMEAKRILPPQFRFVALSKHNRYKMESFRTANLKDGFDVRVKPGQGLPDNKAARLQLVEKGLPQGVGLFSDHPEAVRARDVLGMHVDEDESYEVRDAEEHVIRNENGILSQGQWVDVDETDTHDLHLTRHKQAHMERRAMGETNKQINEMVKRHIQEHKTAVMAEMQAVQAATNPQPAPGGGQPGVGSLPDGAVA
jgi:hypothetical protein